MEQYGIEVMLFDTKQLDLPDDNKEAVYERMISERDNIAATYTAEGSSEAKVIRNTTDKEVAIQISEAKKQAEILEAQGEQEYMKILAGAYGEEGRRLFLFLCTQSGYPEELYEGRGQNCNSFFGFPDRTIFQGNTGNVQ